MRKTLVILGSTLALGVFVVPAVSLSPKAECEATGGTFSKENGTQSCVISEAPGKNQGGVLKIEEETQKGSSRSSHPEEETKGVSNRGGFHEAN